MHDSEKQFAHYLKSQGKTWLYEPRRFKLKATTYKPDFYCPENDIYYEVVGTRQAIWRAKNKIIEFKKSYPNIKFKIVKPNGEMYIGRKFNLYAYRPKLTNFWYLLREEKSGLFEELKEIMKKEGLSHEKLARILGVSMDTLMRCLHKKNKLSNLALIQIRKFIKKEKINIEVVRLRKFKEESGWSYLKIAGRIGVAVQSIINWNQGAVVPSPMARDKIRKFLAEYSYKG